MTSATQTLTLAWAARFALIRLRAGWRSRLTIVVGILLTTIVGALTPLYTTLVAQTGMVRRLESLPPHTVNIYTQVTLSGSDANVDQAWQTLDSAVRADAPTAFDPVIGDWLGSIFTSGESTSMFVVRGGADIEGLKLRLAYYEDLENRAVWSAGTAAAPTNAEYGVVIPLELASRYALEVGDVLTLDQRGWESSVPFTVEITGIISARDPDDAYWMQPSPLRLTQSLSTTEANVFVSRADLLSVMIENVPQARSLIGWRILFDHAALPVGRIAQAVTQARQFEQDLTQNLIPVFVTDLPETLIQYEAELGLLNAPFGVLMLQVGALALFFLVITTALAQRSKRREAAMLQNRGALNGQILLLHGLEALIMSTAAAIIAPFIARQALIWFAPALIDANRVTLDLAAAPFIYAGAAAVLAVFVLIMTLRPVLKLPLINTGGSAMRAARQSWWQRYYVDLIVLILGSAALFRLLSTESPFARSLLGGLRADPMLLIAPALLFFALGSVTLRLFPVLTGAAAGVLSARREASGALASWSVSRDPTQYAQIAFLLALAVGVGWFSVSYQATLARSQADQAQYRVGSDVRLIPNEDAPALTLADYAALEGVESAAAVYRAEGLNFSIDGREIIPGTLIAVDRGTFAQTAYWREDLGELQLPPVSETVDMSIPLPPEANRLRMWIRADEVIIDQTTGELSSGLPLITNLFAMNNFFARVIDENGVFHTIGLGAREIEGGPAVDEIETIFQFELNITPFSSPEEVDAEYARLQALLEGVSGWIRYEGEIPPEVQGELRLDMIFWQNTTNQAFSRVGLNRIQMAGLTALNDDQPVGESLMTADQDWSLTFDNAATTEGLIDRVETGKGDGWQVDWSQRSNQTILGITLMPPGAPVPAVVSAEFAARNALEIGAPFDLYPDSRPVRLQVAAVTAFFPTVYGDQAPFAAADLNALLYVLNRRPGTARYASEVVNEVLIKLEDGIDAETWLTTELRPGFTVQTAQSVQTALRDDALTLGVSRLLFMAFVIALILSVVSLMVYAALNAQARSTEFAVLRALGMSSSQIAQIVGMELVVVFLAAALLGAVMGAMLSQLVLPSLAISPDASRITPPFLVEVQAAALMQYFAVLTVIMAAVIAFTALLIRRLSLGQSLRFQGE